MWDQQLKGNANRQKTKEAMAPLLARFEKAQPPRNSGDQIEVARYMKWQKEDLLMAAIMFSPVHEHKEFWWLSLIGSTFDSVAGTCCIFMASLKPVPATCTMKFNNLNFVEYVTGTKYPPNWFCGTSEKVSVHTKGHVDAIYPATFFMYVRML